MTLLSHLKEIQEDYSHALHLPVSILNEKGEVISIGTFPNPFYAKIIRGNDILKKTFSETIGEKTEKVATLFENVYVFCAPVIEKANIVGYMIGGPVRARNPNILECEQAAKNLRIPMEKYFEVALLLPLFRENKLKAALKLMTKVLGALQKRDLSQASEPASESGQNHISFESVL